MIDDDPKSTMQKLFPVHPANRPENCPDFVPWSKLSEEMATKNHGQSLQQLCNRGGLSVVEIGANYCGLAVRDVTNAEQALALVKELAKPIQN